MAMQQRLRNSYCQACMVFNNTDSSGSDVITATMKTGGFQLLEAWILFQPG